MSQTTLTSFFNSRKRPASEDMVSSKSKILHVEQHIERRKNGLKTFDQDVKQSLKLPVKLSNECKLDNRSKVTVASSVSSPTKSTSEQKSSTAFGKKLNAGNITKTNETSKPDVVNTARKELSLGDIRKKLASSSRLAELRATADRLSKGIQEVKAACDKRNLKEFKSIDLEVPSSPSKKSLVHKELLSPQKEVTLTPQQRPLISPRKVIVSPIKSPSKVPAYIRHASLASSSTSLPLPHQYRFLAELFRGMETVVALLYNRNEKITFNKLKPSVQEMLKRNFTEKHLAQIKHLVPDFYNFEIQKIKSFATSQKDSYEMIITPNFPTDIKIMNPSVLLERRRYFYDTLLQLVKKHHAQYLLTLDPPMVIPDDKLTRWHPEFEIEKVPEIESAKLPELPNAEKLSTAQDVLSKARELFKCNTKMERALEKLAQAKARGLTEQEKVATGLTDTKTNTAGTQTSQPSTSGVTIMNPALRNLPAALLEKVKAKQAAKALEAMTRSSQHEEKYMIYSRLPDLAKTLRNIFVTERKNVLNLNIVLSKLDSSFKANVSANDLLRDIKVLAEQVPEWIKLHDIRDNTYLKLDRNTDLKKIMSKLEALVEKYKCD
ncbi:DNA replication factor Cdt1 [Pectinophora gossypiella]|uniref:DNA replication factor Cdt1 n=1 Tax=Pectinophora gossypiella TaxID=13191 RepID=UPI00214F07B1|nr:DNA replication factor Cdt1 [Pectinophora gossypiella]